MWDDKIELTITMTMKDLKDLKDFQCYLWYSVKYMVRSQGRDPNARPTQVTQVNQEFISNKIGI